MLFFRVLLFFILCTFAVAVPVHHDSKISSVIAKIRNAISKVARSSKGSVDPETDTVKRRMSGYWYSVTTREDSERHDIVYIRSDGTVVIISPGPLVALQDVFDGMGDWLRVTTEYKDSLNMELTSNDPKIEVKDEYKADHMRFLYTMVQRKGFLGMAIFTFDEYKKVNTFEPIVMLHKDISHLELIKSSLSRLPPDSDSD